MLVKLIWECSGDEIVFSPTFPDLLDYYVEQLTQSHKNSFKCSYTKSPPRFLSILEKNIQNVFQHSKKIPMEITDWEGDLYDQNYLNKLHREWVKTGIKFPRLPLLLRSLDNCDEDFRAINDNLHELEKSFFYQFINYEKDPFQVKNIFGSSIVNFSKTNLMLGFSNLGRSSWEKYRNRDNNVNDSDTNNFDMLSGLIELNLDKPTSWAPPKEYVEWCQHFNIPVVGNGICLGNIVNLEHTLTDIRKILIRNNNEQSNKFFFEICS